MAARKKKQVIKEFHIALSSPGMTTLHKVGLAGLWMTLKHFEENEPHTQQKLNQLGITWTLSQDDLSVYLAWTSDEKKPLQPLFEESFRLDENGLIWFPALDEPIQHPDSAVLLQEGMLNTYIQHGRMKSAGSGETTITLNIDENYVSRRFRKLIDYKHQTDTLDTSKKSIPLAGWICPGGAVRHTAFTSKTTLSESPEQALILRYAPIGSIFFKLRQRGEGIRPLYAVVLPELTSLRDYARLREQMLPYGILSLTSAGPAEAALRTLVELQKLGLHQATRALCRVFTFGVVPWSSQQKTRLKARPIQLPMGNEERIIRQFMLSKHLFRPQRINTKEGYGFLIPQCPEWIANNLIHGKPWWDGFADFMANSAVRDAVLFNEREDIAKMMEHTSEQTQHSAFEKKQHAFVQACHQAWSSRMAQIYDQASKENRGNKSSDLIQREFTKWRIRFSRCRNAASVREAVVDFWSRGGHSIPALHDEWTDILYLFTSTHWREGRDLALLALVSYKPRASENKEEPTQTQTQEGA